MSIVVSGRRGRCPYTEFNVLWTLSEDAVVWWWSVVTSLMVMIDVTAVQFVQCRRDTSRSLMLVVDAFVDTFFCRRRRRDRCGR